MFGTVFFSLPQYFNQEVKVSWYVDFNKIWKKFIFAVQVEKTEINILPKNGEKKAFYFSR